MKYFIDHTCVVFIQDGTSVPVFHWTDEIKIERQEILLEILIFPRK